MPPLRERNEDIQLLTEHFLHMYAQKYERPITGVSQAAYQRLFGHAWPGNVRELQNVIERAVLLAKDKQIEPIDLPFDNGTVPEGASAQVTWDVPPNMTLEDIERLVIERTLATHRWKQTGGGEPAGYLSAAPVQQDQEVQYRRTVTGFGIIQGWPSVATACAGGCYGGPSLQTRTRTRRMSVLPIHLACAASTRCAGSRLWASSFITRSSRAAKHVPNNLFDYPVRRFSS